MNLDTALIISDWSSVTLLTLSNRIENSHSLERLTYRESEVDEVWRLVDCALQNSTLKPTERQRLEDIKTCLMDVHELIGHDERPIEAAARLRRLLD